MPATCQALSSYTELVATLLDSTEENLLVIAESYDRQLCSINVSGGGSRNHEQSAGQKSGCHLGSFPPCTRHIESVTNPLSCLPKLLSPPYHGSVFDAFQELWLCPRPQSTFVWLF